MSKYIGKRLLMMIPVLLGVMISCGKTGGNLLKYGLACHIGLAQVQFEHHISDIPSQLDQIGIIEPQFLRTGCFPPLPWGFTPRPRLCV